MKIYLAGKIGKHDWRNTIVSPDALEFINNFSGSLSPEEWPVTKRAIFGTHDYTGPYFVACDHGCYHGETSHGAGLNGAGCGSSLSDKSRLSVFMACRAAIAQSDLVFAYINSLDAYGTFVEIGMAHAMNKPICLLIDLDTYERSMKESGTGHCDDSWLYGCSDIWFSLEAASTWLAGKESPCEYLSRHLGIQNRPTYHEYLQSPEWKATRNAAIERAGHACQFCRSTNRLEVHHNTYERIGREEPGDLVVLCHECHSTLHGVQDGRPTRMPVAS